MSRIVVISDTHGKIPATQRALEMFEEYSPIAVIHCGDICGPEIVALFDRWPTHFVFGNNDYDQFNLRRSMEAAGHVCHETFGSLEIENRRIAFLHSDDIRLFDRTVTSGKYDLVCYGHSHIMDHKIVGETNVLNPGALHRARHYSFAVVDLETLTCQHVLVDR
ncbi:MAG: metallophosphoesterase family protein [Planctomycetaceae bacterium]|nr:metallophosphoesterase family protein [Planctomycetaceae bacterium]